jgi:hypothetical protein
MKSQRTRLENMCMPFHIDPFYRYDKTNGKRVSPVPEASHDLSFETTGDEETLLIHEQAL